MGEKISKGVFHLISLLLLGCVWFEVINKEYLEAISILLLAILINPFVLDRVLKKLGIQETDYLYAVKILASFGGVIFAYVISVLIFNLSDLRYSENAVKDYEAIFKISIYVVYLIILFICKSSDKFFKYIIFGIFYFICIILSFSTDTINKYLIEILNSMPNSNLDVESYNLLVGAFLTPVKESILTYIIFDTVLEGKSYNQKREVVDKIFKDEVESLNKSSVLDKTEANTFKVNVLDNENGQITNYQIQVNKK